MDKDKICFIYKTGEEGDLDETLESINALKVPETVKIEVVKMEKYSSTAEAYNKASNLSDAKYKVYLKPGTLIIEDNFISLILDIFKANSEIALIGAIGAETIPTSGIWWQSKHRCGKIYSGYSGNMTKINYDEFSESLTKKDNLCLVAAIDNAIMITQYEKSFREDLFKGEYFYDTAFGIELLKAGYKIAVPILEKPWVIKKNSEAYFDNSFMKYREIFLTEYSDYLFPKVSIAIPVYYNNKDIKKSINSALEQSYKNKEIILVGLVDSEIQNMVKENTSIRFYEYNAISLEDCCNKCYEISSGKILSYLMVGEILQKHKLDIMVNFFVEYKNISMVVHNTFNKDRDNQRNTLETLASRTIIFKGLELGRFILKNNVNLIGGASGVLFMKEYLEKLQGDKPWQIEKSNKLPQVALWLKLMERGDVVYISSILCNSFMDDNFLDEQEAGDKNSILEVNDFSEININNADSYFIEAEEWLNLIKHYYVSKFISDDKDYYKLLALWLVRYIPLIKWISVDSIAKTIYTESIKNCFKFTLGKLRFSENENFTRLATTVEKIL